jgi:hypothetical protein
MKSGISIRLVCKLRNARANRHPIERRRQARVPSVSSMIQGPSSGEKDGVAVLNAWRLRCLKQRELHQLHHAVPARRSLYSDVNACVRPPCIVHLENQQNLHCHSVSGAPST